jgi:hypothetical protein
MFLNLTWRSDADIVAIFMTVHIFKETFIITCVTVSHLNNETKDDSIVTCSLLYKLIWAIDKKQDTGNKNEIKTWRRHNKNYFKWHFT